MQAQPVVQTQTIKGVVVDAQSRYPLVGANIVVLDTEPLLGTSTDEDGLFTLRDVPVGRQTLKVSFLGYSERTLLNVLTTAGKEVTLTLELTEQVIMAQRVTVRARRAG